MRKTYVINDITWIALALFVCIGGLRLGFGSFRQPHAGFMPFLSGLFLGLLAVADLIYGLAGQWKTEKRDHEIWAGINWGKLVLTLIVLFAYTALFSTLGFLLGTFLLLLFLFRVMEPKPYWVTFMAAVITTILFYLGLKVGLESQLPSGFLGF